MNETERSDALRGYAAGEITWRELQERGFRDDIEVLGSASLACGPRSRR